MAGSSSDAADDNKNGDAKEVEAGNIPNLDQVNDLNQRKLEEDGADGGDDEDEGDDKGAAGNDDEGDAAGDDAGADAGAGDEDADEAAKAIEDAKAKEDEDARARPAAKDEPAAELDSDITKKAKGKVAIKGFDGKTYYFNNLDEVPDDFEPANYKALMVGVDQLRDKANSDAQAAADKALDEQNAANQARITEMEKGWDRDIKSMTDAGTLPKDKAERQKVEEEVYTYMEAQLQAGNPIESFAASYKAMMYDKRVAEDAKQQDKNNDAKKRRGAKVQPGGTIAPGKSVTREAPPPGVSLDDVHSKVMSEL